MKILFILAMLSMSSAATLKWTQSEIELKIHPMQVSAPAVFEFYNVGETPVSIVDVKVSCGCLVPEKYKKEIAPGEKGELKVVFDIQTRTGKQRKTLVVKTSDGQQKSLSIRAEVPRAYTVNPVMLKWVEGAEKKTKVAILKNESSMPLPLKSVESTHRDIQAELKCIRDGFEYQLIITPHAEAKNARGIIRVNAEVPKGLTEAKQLKIYVHVK